MYLNENSQEQAFDLGKGVKAGWQIILRQPYLDDGA